MLLCSYIIILLNGPGGVEIQTAHNLWAKYSYYTAHTPLANSTGLKSLNNSVFFNTHLGIATSSITNTSQDYNTSSVFCCLSLDFEMRDLVPVDLPRIIVGRVPAPDFKFFCFGDLFYCVQGLTKPSFKHDSRSGLVKLHWVLHGQTSMHSNSWIILPFLLQPGLMYTFGLILLISLVRICLDYSLCAAGNNYIY